MNAPMVEIRTHGNPTLEPNITSMANQLQSYGQFIYSRWPSDAILDYIEQEIAPFDPPMPKTHGLEPSMECIECTVCEIFTFKLYCDLETKVRATQGHRKRHYLIEHIRICIRLPQYICIYLLPFPRYSRILIENCYTPRCIRCPR